MAELAFDAPTFSGNLGRNPFRLEGAVAPIKGHSAKDLSGKKRPLRP
jgi:hypothetical protein